MTAIKRERKKRWERGTPGPLRVTERDTEIVRLVAKLAYATRAQVADVLFGGRVSSNCQRRLTLLVQHGYLDKLRERGAGEADVYCLTKRCRNGMRLVERPDRSIRVRRGQLAHVLAINDVRCRFMRDCARHGWILARWRSQGDLLPWQESGGFVPDGYFEIELRDADRRGVCGILLEIERSPRSPAEMRQKYRKVADFLRSGAAEAETGRKALRLLVVSCARETKQERRTATRLCEIAHSAGLSLGWFGTLSDVLAQGGDVISDDVWMRTPASAPRALFEAERVKEDRPNTSSTSLSLRDSAVAALRPTSVDSSPLNGSGGPRDANQKGFTTAVAS